MKRDLFDSTKRSAVISECGRYRYRLARVWGEGPRLVFVMLNPSTADEHANDPTVERCERRARAGGFAGLEVVNLFALRSTDPGALYMHSQDAAVGPLNDAAILDACVLGFVVCAWGCHGNMGGRGERVRAMLAAKGIALHVLALNTDGSPRHPLYLANSCKPKPWVQS